MTRIVTIVQARMGSSRLPGKVLRPLAGRVVLDWVIHRIRLTRLFGTLVIATSALPGDDALAAWCADKAIACFRGSEHDVLDRYYQCSRAHDADVVMRVTADCPLLDPEAFDRVIATHLQEEADYVSVDRMPRGIAQETLSRKALDLSWQRAVLPEEREHVIYHVTRRPREFKVLMLEPPAGLDLPDWTFTLDTSQDYRLLTTLFEITGGKVGDLGLAEIVRLVRRDPDLESLARRKAS